MQSTLGCRAPARAATQLPSRPFPFRSPPPPSLARPHPDFPTPVPALSTRGGRDRSRRRRCSRTGGTARSVTVWGEFGGRSPTHREPGTIACLLGAPWSRRDGRAGPHARNPASPRLPPPAAPPGSTTARPLLPPSRGLQRDKEDRTGSLGLISPEKPLAVLRRSHHGGQRCAFWRARGARRAPIGRWGRHRRTNCGGGGGRGGGGVVESRGVRRGTPARRVRCEREWWRWARRGRRACEGRSTAPLLRFWRTPRRLEDEAAGGGARRLLLRICAGARPGRVDSEGHGL